RRHTRFSRDWSSDVCSSDLRIVLAFHGGGRAGRARFTLDSSERTGVRGAHPKVVPGRAAAKPPSEHRTSPARAGTVCFSGTMSAASSCVTGAHKDEGARKWGEGDGGGRATLRVPGPSSAPLPPHSPGSRAGPGWGLLHGGG